MWSSFTDWLTAFWNDHSGTLIATIVILVVAVVVNRVIRRALARWERKVEREFYSSDKSADRERGQRLITITDVARLSLAIVVWTTALLTITAIWGVPMTAFLAVGSTIGVAIGFGAQDFVRDVIAGFLILVEDQYSIGDVVRVAGAEGTVEGIKLRTTVLRDLDGNRHFVPNGEIRVATNMTSEFSRLVVDVQVSYDADLDAAMAVILDESMSLAYEDEWRTHFLEEPQMLGVNKLDDSSIHIRLLLTLTSDSRWLVKRELLKRLKQRLDVEGISIPYAHMRVLVENVDGQE